MNVAPLGLDGLVMIEPRIHRDARGWFAETWSAQRYREVGLPDTWVQDNVSHSVRGVVRGLHFQEPHGQGKLAMALVGEVFDVAVDVRVGSPTFGQWAGFVLSETTGRQLYIPPGFAHGYLVTSDVAVFAYKCTDYYDPSSERAVLWNDPDLGVEWPLPASAATWLSDKDRAAPRLRDLPPDRLPRYSR